MKKACSDVKMTGQTCAFFMASLILFSSLFGFVTDLFLDLIVFFDSIICPASWMQRLFWCHYFVKDKMF